jgi:UDP-N-acetylmuramoyl-tripeptide--D-alanyl-D-alanine ligase
MALPDIGVITNAGAEHLEGFGSLEGVARAEGETVAGLLPAGTAIINADDPYEGLWRASTSASVLRFGLAHTAEFHAQGLSFALDEQGFRTRFTLCAPAGRAEITLALAGRHNVLNALAAAAAATSAGATLSEIVVGLAGMRAVTGRLQLRRSRVGAWLIDDSYNANPSSVRAGLTALREMPGRRWLVLGDMAELGAFAVDSHRELGTLARDLGVERLYTFGSLAALAADTFGSGAERFDEASALARALEAALGPDVLLLIKGSRVNRLERVVEALAAQSPPLTGTATDRPGAGGAARAP